MFEIYKTFLIQFIKLGNLSLERCRMATEVNDDEEDSSVNSLWGQMILTNNIMMMTVIIMMTVITLK